MKTNQPIQSCIKSPFWRCLARLLLSINCILLTVTACSGDDGTDIGNAPVAVQFASSVDNVAKPQTRTTAGGTQWTAGDKIGIFMLNENAPLASGNIAGGADNKAYKAQTDNNATSSFTPDDGTPIYYPITGKVDFVAYYPHTILLTNYKLAVDVSDQSDASKIDVLYSNNATGKDKNSGTVNLEFSHALSKISFTLKAGIGAPNLTNAKISISKLKTAADVDLADGLVKNLSTETTITAHTNATAIVLPQTTDNSSKLTVTLADGNTFECDFSNKTFVQSKNHGYTITVDRTSITVSAGDITLWEGTNDAPTEGDTAIRYKVGDYYPDPNVVYTSGAVTSGTAAIGIVYWLKDPVNSKSKHGKIVSLKEGSNLNWNAWAGNNGATDLTNGIPNMKAMYTITLGETWATFQAYEWVHSLNPSITDYADSNAKHIWYLPAKDELSTLYANYSVYGKNAFNERLTATGGTGFSNSYYWSSSENDNNLAWLVYFSAGLPFNFTKSLNCRVRGVSAF